MAYTLKDLFQWRASTTGQGYTAGGLSMKIRVIDGVVKVKVGGLYVEPKEFLDLMKTLVKGPSKDDLEVLASKPAPKSSHLSVVEDDEPLEDEDEYTEDDTDGDDSVH